MRRPFKPPFSSRTPGEIPISDWQAHSYDQFSAARQKPARDLLAEVPDFNASRITDLGCGSGLSTMLLAERWPEAELLGVDSSPAMLERAKTRVPHARFVEADIAEHHSTHPQDLIFANASLHWLGDHRRLFPDLLNQLRTGGYLALQMPNNLHEPSHTLMRSTSKKERYARFLHSAQGIRPTLLQAEDYFDCFRAAGASVTVWETRYLHALDSAQRIREWYATTGLKPYLDALPKALRDGFLAEYEHALQEAYPTRIDGRVLLAVPRLFLIARRED